MSWLSSMLKTESTYWPPPQRDGYGGYIWSSSSTILTRWQHRNSLVYLSAGSEVVSTNEVWSVYSVDKGGYLLEGKSSLEEPPVDAKQIIIFESIESLHDNNIEFFKSFLR